MTIKTTPTQEEVENYSEKDEIKDTKKFSKLINNLSNAQFAILFSLIIGEYSTSNLSEALDLTLDYDIKEELSDLWTFRRSHGLGE